LSNPLWQDGAVKSPEDAADHHRRLERLYASAPITQWYGARISVADGEAEVRVTVRPEFFHAAAAVHGSVYFRLLDDAAFFAVNSRVPEVFVLTVSFTVQLARPVAAGEIRARGRVRHGGGRLFLADSELFDDRDQLLGHGSGVFSRSAIPLDARVGYV
jgi:uncharacterized protein (TIGR00369 family)